MRVVSIILCAATPCWADPWIDYDLLLEQNADKVVVSTDATGAVTRNIDFGNGVTVTCTDQGCVGIDRNGAVGCAWAIFSELLAVAEVCELPPERTASMTGLHRLQSAFIARNAIPPRSLAEVEAVHQGVVARYRADLETNPQACKELLAPEADMTMMLDGIAAQAVDLDVAAQAMATPRLPVMNPCL
jgi:hypothetical protein